VSEVHSHPRFARPPNRWLQRHSDRLFGENPFGDKARGSQKKRERPEGPRTSRWVAWNSLQVMLQHHPSVKLHAKSDVLACLPASWADSQMYACQHSGESLGPFSGGRFVLEVVHTVRSPT